MYPLELQVTFKKDGQLHEFGPLPSVAQAELVCDILSSECRSSGRPLLANTAAALPPFPALHLAAPPAARTPLLQNLPRNLLAVKKAVDLQQPLDGLHLRSQRREALR